MKPRVHDAGPFRIHVVSQMTGVPEPTLRAWERRYGVPRPARTDAGYRLYGEEEVAAVMRMRDLCNGGMSAAEAAQRVSAGSSQARASTSPADAFAAAAQAIVEATARFDDRALDEALASLTLLGPPREAAERALVPALHKIGDLWEEGTMSVAHEHFASQRIGGHLRTLLRLRAPGPGRRPRVIVAAWADDEHDVATLVVALAATDFAEPVVLGARTPPVAIAAAIRAVAPDAVMLSVTIPPPRDRGRTLVDAYADACGDVPWIVGGAGSAPIAERVAERGGTAVGVDLAAGVRALAGFARRTKRTAG
jgi:DNA-binding transcriptional MerR regulator/methylmalonyl-CoA mutase cobalamin-binding subunit